MTTIAAPPAARVDALPWDELTAQLDTRGFAVTDPVLDAGECEALAALFEAGRFRSTVDMARHRFGDGRYRYFDHPLPEPIGELRAAFYARLASVGAPARSRRRTRSCSSAAAPRGRRVPPR
jgi:hypothetical protein